MPRKTKTAKRENAKPRSIRVPDADWNFLLLASRKARTRGVSQYMVNAAIEKAQVDLDETWDRKKSSEYTARVKSEK